MTNLFGIDSLIKHIGLEDDGNKVVAIFSDSRNRPGVYTYMVLDLEVLHYPQMGGWCFKGGTSLFSLDQTYRKSVKELFARFIQANVLFEIEPKLLGELAESILNTADEWIAEEQVLEEPIVH